MHCKQRYVWAATHKEALNRGSAGYTLPETAARLRSSAGQQEMPVWRVETFVTLASEPSVLSMMEVAYDKEWGNDEDAEQQTAWDSNSDRS